MALALTFVEHAARCRDAACRDVAALGCRCYSHRRRRAAPSPPSLLLPSLLLPLLLLPSVRGASMQSYCTCACACTSLTRHGAIPGWARAKHLPNRVTLRRMSSPGLHVASC